MIRKFDKSSGWSSRGTKIRARESIETNTVPYDPSQAAKENAVAFAAPSNVLLKIDPSLGSLPPKKLHARGSAGADKAQNMMVS